MGCSPTAVVSPAISAHRIGHCLVDAAQVRPQAVVRQFIEDGRGRVEIEREARNQDGELSVIGGGIVELPAR